ncbi:MAG: hypothetical protein PHR26_02995 [Candidatus ainarchaeum sp.]|nr:hypothetical protein [Candidatus ainarchaeum sp.]MDD3975562.1 hypothetical protein [Candidatus ainarchaeum sp.]
MISLNTWNTLFQGKFGNQELNILYKDDIFVTFLKLKDNENALIQVYKIFLAKGDLEIFANTLPYPAIIFEKHLDIGEKNNYKYLLLHTDVEHVDFNTLSYHVDKKINKLNQRVSSIISVVKSYDLKLVSLKLAKNEEINYFFSDPSVVKILTNLPLSFNLNESTTLEKFILGKKEGVLITTTIDQLKSVGIFGSNLAERIFVMKIIIENYLLSSKTIVIFDSTNMFVSLAYPQQNLRVLENFDLKMDPFGFPIKVIDYFSLKIPLFSIPKSAFINIFKFSNISELIISKAYDKNIINISNLRENVSKLEINDEITDFEKQRVISKLVVLEDKYNNLFGISDIKKLFEQRYTHIGTVKILNINKDHIFYSYYIDYILKQISLNIKKEILIVFPELSEIFNNIFIGENLFNEIKDNPNISYILSSKYKTDFRKEKVSEVNISMISENDGVITYPNRDPLRLLFRPTFTSSVIKYKE